MEKERIDVLLAQQGFFDSRERAKRAVMAGIVLVNDERIDKPGEKVLVDAVIRIKGEVSPYVGRGGVKLKRAVDAFGLDLTDRIVLDVGASTGGFTDCALQNGARLSYAVDVGYNQLAWKLRQDERVISLERTNFRYMESAVLAFGLPSFACVDVSFISLRLILPTLEKMLMPDGEAVLLIKPQFEAGREQVGKNGIVKDAKVHTQVIRDIIDFVAELKFGVLGLTPSPIKGGEGNIEFLIHITRQGGIDVTDELIKDVVKSAHT